MGRSKAEAKCVITSVFQRATNFIRLVAAAKWQEWVIVTYRTLISKAAEVVNCHK